VRITVGELLEIDLGWLVFLMETALVLLSHLVAILSLRCSGISSGRYRYEGILIPKDREKFFPTYGFVFGSCSVIIPDNLTINIRLTTALLELRDWG
jgi:hypothetical protein